MENDKWKLCFSSATVGTNLKATSVTTLEDRNGNPGALGCRFGFYIRSESSKITTLAPVARDKFR